MRRSDAANGMGTTEEQRRLVDQHLSLVRAQASDVMKTLGLPAAIEFDDLVSFGTTGLIEAAQRYQPGHGAAFATFAYYRVRGAMYDGLRSFGWVNKREYARLREHEQVDAYLQSHAERASAAAPRSLEDDVAALAGVLEGAATVFVTALALRPEAEPLDERPPADEALALGRLGQTVRAALRELPAKERAIVEAFYFRDRNLQDAGRELGISKSWASRVHANAIDQLRERLATTHPAASADAAPELAGAPAPPPAGAPAPPPAGAPAPPPAGAPARATARGSATRPASAPAPGPAGRPASAPAPGPAGRAASAPAPGPAKPARGRATRARPGR